MKLLIAYDQVFSVTAAGAVFTAGELSYEILKRYQDVFDEVLVVGRKEEVDLTDTRALSRCDGPGISFCFLPNLSTASAFFGTRQQARMRLEALIVACDVVLARLPSEIGLLATDITRWAQRSELRNKSWGVELVGCPFDALRYHGSPMAALYAPLMAARVRRAVAAAPFVHYVTDRFLQARYPAKGQTAAFSDVLLPQPCPITLETRLAHIAQSGRPLIFGLIGTLQVRYKGIAHALRALQAVRDELGDVVFRVLGPGDPTPWQKLARTLGLDDVVRFDGVLPHGADVLAWLDGLDVYLQPSLTEALPRGLIEAMSRALPVLASSAGEVSNLLDPSCLHPPGDWQALAGDLLEAQKRPWLEAMSRRNFERARDFAPCRLDTIRRHWLERIADAPRLAMSEAKAVPKVCVYGVDSKGGFAP